MRQKLLILFFCIASLNLYSQSGINIYAGIANASNVSALITPNSLSHKGNILGADARLNSDNMYFMLGGQMTRINFLADSDSKYFSVENKMTWLKLRVGLGYNLFNINENMAITAKTLGSINVISTHPTLDQAPYDNYNASTAAVILGLGFSFYNFNLEAEYEKGFFNAVNMVEGTEFNFINVTLGYKI